MVKLFILVGFDLRRRPSIRIHQFAQALFKDASETSARFSLPVVPAGGILQKDRQAGIEGADDIGLSRGCPFSPLPFAPAYSKLEAFAICPFPSQCRPKG